MSQILVYECGAPNRSDVRWTLLPTLICLGWSAPAAHAEASAPANQAGEFGRAGQPAGAARSPQAGPAASSPRDHAAFTAGEFNQVKPGLPTLVIAGDSTAATGDPTHRGWGAVLTDYFDADKVNVINRARGGRSFRTFVGEGLWNQVLAAIKPGDFVVIQFGHNDGGNINDPKGRADLPGTGDETQTVTKPDGTAETVHTYGWYTRKFVRDVQEKKAIPILMTTTVRDDWKDGQVMRGLGSMHEIAVQIAREEKALLIDHSHIIADRYQKMGQPAVDVYFPADHTHTSTEGAIVNAEMFIAGLKALPGMPLSHDLNEKGRAIAAYQPTPNEGGAKP